MITKEWTQIRNTVVDVRKPPNARVSSICIYSQLINIMIGLRTATNGGQTVCVPMMTCALAQNLTLSVFEWVAHSDGVAFMFLHVCVLFNQGWK